MAGAVLPLVVGAIPIVDKIFDLIAGVVHKTAPVAEATHGPGTGPVKYADVYLAAQEALTKAHAVGQIEGTLPDEVSVKIIVQSVLSSLKLQGLLTSDLVPVTPAASKLQITQTQGNSTVTLAAGQTLTVSVK